MHSETNKERIETLFLKARRLPPDDRVDFLHRECPHELEIREAVEHLLVADANPVNLLDEPVDLGVTQSESGTQVFEFEGRMVGPYKLLQKLGEGGFGVVYMAEQETPIRRKVALKLIKPGMDSKEVLARFEAERQALAMMDHPNIAKVLDAGKTDSGHPYFAMELVKGVPITKYCDCQSLDARHRLKLFIKVCLAIQHAHQKGIIHRDIKPSNVMITMHDGEPVPKVIDFGVAKALSHPLTEKTLFTRYGQFIGTPQYMSPEQAEMSGLEIDARSDIYSLGILLYELLTGHTPLNPETLRTASFDAMKRMICDSEPSKPSARVKAFDAATATSVASLRSSVPVNLAKQFSGDVDCIVMTCLEKERGRRYESATGLLNDVQRHLRDEPIQAGPPAIAYQLKKMYRRNRKVMTSMMAVGAMLTVGIVAITIAWANASEAHQIAASERDKARAAEILAKKEEAKAKASLEALQALLSKAAPSVSDGSNIKLVDFLRDFSDGLDELSFDDGETELAVRMTVARALNNFSLEEAGQHWVRSEQLARVMFSPGSVELANALREIANGHKNGRSLLEEALNIYDAKGDDFPTTTKTLIALSDTVWEPEVEERHLRRACDLYEQMTEAERRGIARIPHSLLAMNLLDQGRRIEAMSMANKGLGLLNDSESSKRVDCLLVKSSILDANGREPVAFEVAQDARGVASQSNRPALKIRVWEHQMHLEFFQKNFDDARTKNLSLQVFDDVQRDWQQIHSLSPAALLGNLYGALISVDLNQQAGRVEGMASSLSEGAQRVFHHRVAQWLRMHGDIAESITHYRERPNDIWAQIQCGRSYAAVRDFVKQLECLREAQRLAEQDPPNRWTGIGLKHDLALCLKMLEKPEATEVFRELIEELPHHSERLYGDFTAGLYIWSHEELRRRSPQDVPVDGTRFSLSMSQLNRETADWANELTFKHAALGMVAERGGDAADAIREFSLSNLNRPGKFAVHYGEWITDHLINLLVAAGRIHDAEKILREDVVRRDGQVSPINPERAFVRIRLIEFLLEHERDLEGVKELYDEAIQVFEYHQTLMPEKEKRSVREIGERIDALAR